MRSLRAVGVASWPNTRIWRAGMRKKRQLESGLRDKAPSFAKASATSLLRDLAQAEILRHCAIGGRRKSVRHQATLEQLTNGRSAAGHAARKAPVVHLLQFRRRQHDLKPLSAI